MPDKQCIHHLDLCDECGGLQVTEYVELNGVTGVTITDDTTGVTRTLGEGTRLYWSPGPTPCEPDHPAAEGEGRP